MQLNIAFADEPSQVDAEAAAFRFLKRYAKAHTTSPWSPEAAIEAAARKGIYFGNQRHWGKVFSMARDAQLIRQAEEFPRKTSNGSKRPGWIGVA